MADFRVEKKYLVSSADARLLQRQFSRLLHCDPFYRSFDPYLVSSLYFDDPNLSAFYEKTAGVNHRVKFRIRYYNDSNDFIRLEKKEKIGDFCRKTGERVSLDMAQRLISDPSFSADTQDVLSDFCLARKSEKLLPAIIVSYRRTVFCHPVGNVRITFDSALSAATPQKFFQNPLGFPVGDPSTVLMEVKFDTVFPPFLSEVMENVPKLLVSHSKYSLCREIFL